MMNHEPSEARQAAHQFQIIRQALHPYPAELVIVTKLGARRPSDGSWQRATSPEELTA
jgi:hypothetical protein